MLAGTPWSPEKVFCNAVWRRKMNLQSRGVFGFANIAGSTRADSEYLDSAYWPTLPVYPGLSQESQVFPGVPGVWSKLPESSRFFWIQVFIRSPGIRRFLRMRSRRESWDSAIFVLRVRKNSTRVRSFWSCAHDSRGPGIALDSKWHKVTWESLPREMFQKFVFPPKLTGSWQRRFVSRSNVLESVFQFEVL